MQQRENSATSPWRMLHAALGLSVLLHLVGCSSTEMLVKIPSISGIATIDDYSIDTYQNAIELFSPAGLEQKMLKKKLQKRTRHVFVLIDTSPEMQENYRNISRQDYAFEILQRFHHTLPDMGLQGGVAQTHCYGKASLFSSLNCHEAGDRTLPLVGPYQPEVIQQKIDKQFHIQHVGVGNLATAISELSPLISDSAQSAALVILSNWENIDSEAVYALSRLRLKSTQQQEICAYAVGVGNQYSRSRFDAVDQCGFSVAADKIAQPRDMSHFIERIFFYGPADTDNDGIYDYLDKCPNTQPGRLIGFDGCNRFPEPAVDPVVTNSTAEDRKKNRRVEIYTR